MAKVEVLTEDFAMQHSQIDDLGLDWSFPKPNQTITMCGKSVILSCFAYQLCKMQLGLANGICAPKIVGPCPGAIATYERFYSWLRR